MKKDENNQLTTNNMSFLKKALGKNASAIDEMANKAKDKADDVIDNVADKVNVPGGDKMKDGLVDKANKMADGKIDDIADNLKK